jgi:nitroimidazol reductase NimA-like FMN-containing flavoprotein (pyridoxamine 5'-phosphate oxidase superfamily)
MIDNDDPGTLTRAGCLRLLGTKKVGRVVFTASAMPAVQPVEYTVHGDEVVFQALDGSTLSAATEHCVVGFQVDDIDPVDRIGWSVFGVGQAYAISRTDPRALPGGSTWSHAVAVPLQQLTGQRLHLGPRRIGAP